MNHWLENSIRNLVPMSKSTDFTEALGEWFFTGAVEDYGGEDDEIYCELCEHPDLAHHFEIRNSFTENSLLVGSSCILKFSSIEIRDETGRLVTDRAERESRLKQALRKRIIESGLEPLRKLWQKDRANRSGIQYLASNLKNDSGIEPDELLFLLKQMDSFGITHSSKNYKINLRSAFEKAQILKMSVTSLRSVLPNFSKEQLARIRTWRTDF